MDVKLDVNDVVNKSVGVSTKFAGFWRGMVFPNNIGPALSFLLVLAFLPLVGSVLAGLIPQPIFLPFRGLVWTWRPVFGIISGIFFYAYFLGAPLLVGLIMGALDKPLGINKAEAPAYTTVLAYAYAPWAFGALLQFIPFVGWIIGLLLAVLSLIALYLGLTVGIQMDSGQAIIMIVISGLIAWLIFMILMIIVVFGLGSVLLF